MNVVIYTKDAQEYNLLSKVLAQELPDTVVCRGTLDGHFHPEYQCEIAVISVDGAQGMELVCAYREIFAETLVIWITGDPYFAGVAIRTHIFDFIVRPFAAKRFGESIRNIREGKIDAWQTGVVKGNAIPGGAVRTYKSEGYYETY